MQEKDRNQNGKLTIEQVRDIYRIYKVELDEKTLKKYFEESDELNKDDFIKLATETKLTEFHAGDAVFSSKGGGTGVVKPNQAEDNVQQPGSKRGFLCCISKDYVTSPRCSKEEERRIKVERAFKKFDLNGDGFLSWDEFIQINGLDINAAQRIFKACDKETEGKITLEQFHSIVTRKYPQE